MIAKLLVLEGPDQGKSYILRSRNIFGRHPDCSFVLNDKGISGNHCKIELVNQREFVISDLNSSNGTFLNSKKITSEKLKPGDILILGKTKLIYQTESKHQDDSTLMVEMSKITAEIQENMHCDKPVARDWKYCPYCGKAIVLKPSHDL